jgi:photosystem II stability/assembly factor-like uncharacterized protein
MEKIELQVESHLRSNDARPLIKKRTLRDRLRTLLTSLLALLWLSGPAAIRAQENVWTGLGPEGAHVTKLVLHPTTPGTIYAGTSNRGILKSTDRGAIWSEVNNGLSSTYILSLTLDPISPDTLYAGTNDTGLFKSTDGGASWFSIRGDLPPSYAIYSIAVDAESPSTLYAGTVGDCFLDITCRGRVFKSVNGGQHWKIAGQGFSPDSGSVSLTIDPINPEIIYVASYGADSTLFKSTDAGKNWEVLPTPSIPVIITLAIDPANPSTLYVGTAGLSITPSISRVFKGIYKSTDGGTTWAETTAGLTNFNINAIAIDPKEPTTLYAASDAGVFRSGNGGANWSDLNDGLANHFVSDLLITHNDHPALYAGTASGIFAVEPAGPVPPPVLRITGAFLVRRKLYLFGENFAEGAKLLLNGVERKARNDPFNPAATLISKKAGRRIQHGDKLQVLNPDGRLSPEFMFRR